MKRMKKINVIVWLLVLVMLISACGGADKAESAVEQSFDSVTSDMKFNGIASGSGSDYAEEPMEEMEMSEESTELYDGAAAEESTELNDGATAEEGLENTVASNRKLIRRVNMTVETQNFPELTQYIEDKVTELGGYMENSEVYGGSFGSSSLRSASYIVRVPVDKLDALVGAVSQQGNVTRKNESATDVTLSYVDTKSRKEAYEVEYERLMVLLEKAEDIDTIVALESRLTSVRYEIQGLESQLRTYDNLVDFATIEIYLNEVAVYTPVEKEEKSDLQRMAEGFMNSIENILYDMKEFLIDFVIALPYLVLWAIIIGIVVWIVRIIKKKKKLKKDRKQNADRKENRVCDTDRKTERGEVNADESSDRSENSDNIQ